MSFDAVKGRLQAVYESIYLEPEVIAMGLYGIAAGVLANTLPSSSEQTAFRGASAILLGGVLIEHGRTILLAKKSLQASLVS
jgi:hypothetical protein